MVIFLFVFRMSLDSFRNQHIEIGIPALSNFSGTTFWLRVIDLLARQEWNVIAILEWLQRQDVLTVVPQVQLRIAKRKQTTTKQIDSNSPQQYVNERSKNKMPFTISSKYNPKGNIAPCPVYRKSPICIKATVYQVQPPIAKKRTGQF